jgi:hypothetical protein
VSCIQRFFKSGDHLQDAFDEEAREAGPVHAGHQMREQLGLTGILRAAGLPDRACRLSEAMTLNRLISLLPEHAMPDWMRRTAVGDILALDSIGRQQDDLCPLDNALRLTSGSGPSSQSGTLLIGKKNRFGSSAHVRLDARRPSISKSIYDALS